MFPAIHDGNPSPDLLSYQYIQNLPRVADGQSMKLMIIPSDAVATMGAVAALGAGFQSGEDTAADGPAARARSHGGDRLGRHRARSLRGRAPDAVVRRLLSRARRTRRCRRGTPRRQLRDPGDHVRGRHGRDPASDAPAATALDSADALRALERGERDRASGCRGDRHRGRARDSAGRFGSAPSTGARSPRTSSRSRREQRSRSCASTGSRLSFGPSAPSPKPSPRSRRRSARTSGYT